MLIVIVIPWNRYFVAHTPPDLESAWTNSVFFLTTLRKQHTWRSPAFRRQIQYILYKIHKLRWRQHKQHREVKCSADEFRLLFLLALINFVAVPEGGTLSPSVQHFPSVIMQHEEASPMSLKITVNSSCIKNSHWKLYSLKDLSCLCESLLFLPR